MYARSFSFTVMHGPGAVVRTVRTGVVRGSTYTPHARVLRVTRVYGARSGPVRINVRDGGPLMSCAFVRASLGAVCFRSI